MAALLTLLAQSDFLDPNSGPRATGGFRVDPTVFVVVFGAGFLLGVAGHLYRSRTLVAIGIAMIFLATVLVPVFLAASN